MKKRISLLIGALALTLSFTGCGSKKELDYDKAQLTDVTEFVIVNFQMMDEDVFDDYRGLSEYQINKIMSDAGTQSNRKYSFP